MSAVAFVCLTAGLLAAVVLLVRQQQITSRLRRRNAALEEMTRVRDEELGYLVRVRVPALADFFQGKPVEVPGPLNPAFAGTSTEQGIRAILGMFAEYAETAKDRADQAAKVTLKAMMRAVQSLTNEQQLTISTMQERHDDPDVLGGLMKIDHMNAQLGRRAQATSVLCGSWPGQQRSAAALVDVVRGATSRIRDYLRVQVQTQANLAVVSRVVEPVVLTVAELLDNAARHSQPNTMVEVNFRQTHNGVAIVIDDAGVAMDAEELQRAERLLSGRESTDINRLGDPPQVGFAVVGVLAARYGFRVSVDSRSPYGGVRAVVFLPSELLTRVDTEPAPVHAQSLPVHTQSRPMRAEPRPVHAAPTPPIPPTPALSSEWEERPVTEWEERPVTEREERPLTANGLPKRRRVTPTGEQPVPSAGAPPSTRPADEIASGMGAWQRGSRAGRVPVSPESEGNVAE
ncbi:ATP-binding protein [Actinoallomurus purpureus]|uniref:ATP-binding protein n=1 Tax=Actinoallomurus purpureus TaxID=478114 RepID=UPI002093CA12|nr:ATP-binding protein [Actinoallomurus purpureus]MCO6010135.1 ATP-binding protein [Actinoallomurus purpureus]